MRSEEELRNRLSEVKDDIILDLQSGMNVAQYMLDEVRTLKWVLEEEDK